MFTKIVLSHYSVAKGVEWSMEVLPIGDLGAQYFMSKSISKTVLYLLYCHFPEEHHHFPD